MADAFFNRGLTYYKLNNTTKAIADLQTAAQLFKTQEKTEYSQKALNLIKEIKTAQKSLPNKQNSN
jgi:hypothetical protein